MPIGAKIAVRMATAGVVNIDEIAEAGEALKAGVEVAGDEVTKAAEEFVDELFRNAERQQSSIDLFRHSLSSIATAVSQKTISHAESDQEATKAFPIVFIVDELDRCRPPFALSVVERIKHLFSVQGVCFVLVTHLPQLERVVEGAYGAGVDGQAYLEKFYQLKLTLPTQRRDRIENRSAYIVYLWKELGLSISGQHDESVIKNLVGLSNIHDLSLRQIERVVSNLALVAAAVGPRTFFVAPLVVGLCLMRQLRPQLYSRAKAGSLSWLDAREFLYKISSNAAPDAMGSLQTMRLPRSDWVVNWWRYATLDKMTDGQLQEHERGLWDFDIDRERVLPTLAGYVDELFQPMRPR